MGSTRRLAHLHTHPRHPGGMAPLWGRHRGRGESGLHQTHRPPPSSHDPQRRAGGPRGRHNPPPSRTTGPQHMPTLDTPPDGHDHRHEHAPVEPTAALLPSPHHAILTNHTCPEEGPLAVRCGDLHHHPKGTINTIDLVGASITVVYVILSQMRVLHHSGAYHTPFLQLPGSSTSTSRRRNEQGVRLCQEAQTCEQPTETSNSSTCDPSQRHRPTHPAAQNTNPSPW